VKIALALMLEEARAGLDQLLSFHRDAGVDVVLVGGQAPVVSDVLRDFVQHVDGAGSHSDLARVAVDRFAAEWIVLGMPDEIWWPRGESLKDVLAVIPPRYGVVQGLVRTFVGAAEPSTAGASDFAARTVRTTLLGPDGAGGESLQTLLRPVYRAGPNMTLDAADWTLGGRRVPLRAWYPLEVFRYPANAAWDGARVDAGLADGSLVVDTRLRDALADGAKSFPVPSIVDDSSYAVECAAVGEVDLVRLDRQIRGLELRIAELEARFWPRVRQRLKQLARRGP
jgi:hypothetical protein